MDRIKKGTQTEHLQLIKLLGRGRGSNLRRVAQHRPGNDAPTDWAVKLAYS